MRSIFMASVIVLGASSLASAQVSSSYLVTVPIQLTITGNEAHGLHGDEESATRQAKVLGA